VDRVPAAYITGEAWLGGLRFHVDERVLIPRSYFVEILPEQVDPWLPDPARVTRVADVCTGPAASRSCWRGISGRPRSMRSTSRPAPSRSRGST
jgi:hypothetical protein